MDREPVLVLGDPQPIELIQHYCLDIDVVNQSSVL